MEWPREGGTDDEGFELTDLDDDDEPNHDIIAASHLQGCNGATNSDSGGRLHHASPTGGALAILSHTFSLALTYFKHHVQA
jgi:hypothetical protein